MRSRHHPAPGLFRNAQLWRRTLLALMFVGCAVALPATADAATLITLHSFCPLDDCSDGNGPNGLIIDPASGTLFGTTVGGGANGMGVVFALTPGGGTYAYQVLYNFCSLANCADGSRPFTSLILDTNGALYGTTMNGGAHNNDGTAFSLTPSGGGSWVLKTLYDFCAATACADGAQPGQNGYGGLTYAGAESGALYDGVSALYGTTPLGGAQDAGVAFRLTPGAGKAKEKVIHDFCSQAGCADGQTPNAVIVGPKGNLFGTTQRGGGGNGGTVFALKIKGTETVLYNFCPQGSNCTDGEAPDDRVVLDAKGHLFGTTNVGGAHSQGTVFKVIPKGLNSTQTVLYSFCALSGCADGFRPFSAPTFDAAGRLVGTTQVGGAHNGGTVFRLKGTKETVLYDFCAVAGCADGTNVIPGVVLDSSGNVFGATVEGGANNRGTVFELKP